MADSLLIDLERRLPGGLTVRAKLAPLLPGQVTVLFGPSGAGKSTILRCVAGLERPDMGVVRMGQNTWFDATTWLTPQRRGVGLLLQDPALFPHLTVAENVGFGVRDRAARPRIVAELLARFGLEALAGRRPHEISGGEAQRVALARVLAHRPSVLLLDEPLSALDLAARDELRRELRSLLRSLEVPSLVVTHDRAEALALGDRLVLLQAGEVLQDGACDAVFRGPASGRAARVLGVENVWAARRAGELVGFAGLSVGATAAPVGALVACVHAADVRLGAPAEGGARGRVVALEAEGSTMRVLLDAGVPVVARVAAALASHLREGEQVGFSVAAGAVHLAPE